MEIVLTFDYVEKAIDDYLITREVISHHFHSKGLRAFFLPKAPNEFGNGCHIHISLWKDGENVLGDSERKYGLSRDGEAFMAGILEHYNALCHFMSPSPCSLHRISPESWTGGYKIWGVENKEAPIRLL